MGLINDLVKTPVSVTELQQHSHGEKFKRYNVEAKEKKLFSINDLYVIVTEFKKIIAKKLNTPNAYEIQVTPHDAKWHYGWYIGKSNPLNQHGFYIFNVLKYTKFTFVDKIEEEPIFMEIDPVTGKDVFLDFNLKQYDAFGLWLKRTNPLFINSAFAKSVFVGNSKNNDCVYEFLESLYMPVPFTRDNLKKYCNVKRKDKINLCDFKKIEDHPKYKDCRFLISSDCLENSYISEKTNFKYTFNGINKNGHLVTDKQYRKHDLVVSDVDKKICMFFDNIDKETFTVYYKTGYEELSKASFYKLYKMNINAPKHTTIFVKVNSKDLKTEYDQFIKDSDIIKSETKGYINLYKTGSFRTTVLNLLYKSTNHITFDKIPLVEQLFIHYCYKGAIMMCQPNYIGQGYKYDIRSFYGYIMSNHKNQYPFKQGSFIKLSIVDFEKWNFINLESIDVK